MTAVRAFLLPLLLLAGAAQAQERFAAGVAGSVETTNAQASVAAARDALIQARVSYGSARVSAYRALGAIDQIR